MELTMASMSKWAHFSFPFVIFFTTLLFLISNNLFFTLNYSEQLQDEFQNLRSHLNKTLIKPNWFEVVPREIKDEKIETGVTSMEAISNGFHTHVKKNMSTYLERVRNPEWFEIVRDQITGVEAIKIGLVNIEELMDKVHHKNLEIVKVKFTPLGYNEIPWPELSPERMDEYSKCPDIPMPRFEDYQDLDVVVARVPRRQECQKGVMRDASRLQVNLLVANLLIRSARKGDRPVFAVFLDSCDPMLEIFRCEDQLWNEGNSWVYKPELTRIKQLMLMPVGPCQFVPPFSQFGNLVLLLCQHICPIDHEDRS